MDCSPRYVPQAHSKRPLSRLVSCARSCRGQLNPKLGLLLFTSPPILGPVLKIAKGTLLRTSENHRKSSRYTDTRGRPCLSGLASSVRPDLPGALHPLRSISSTKHVNMKIFARSPYNAKINILPRVRNIYYNGATSEHVQNPTSP